MEINDERYRIIKFHGGKTSYRFLGYPTLLKLRVLDLDEAF